MEERYQRNRIYITPEEQCKVKETKILLGGVGLGSVIAECALRLGFETITRSVSIKGVSSLFSAICSLMFPSFHVFGTKVRQFPRTAKAHSYQSIILEGVKSAACQISLCRK